jgi:hypothetical protein
MANGLLAAFTACRELVEQSRADREAMGAEIARHRHELTRGLLLRLQWTGGLARRTPRSLYSPQPRQIEEEGPLRSGGSACGRLRGSLDRGGSRGCRSRWHGSHDEPDVLRSREAAASMRQASGHYEESVGHCRRRGLSGVRHQPRDLLLDAQFMGIWLRIASEGTVVTATTPVAQWRHWSPAGRPIDARAIPAAS